MRLHKVNTLEYQPFLKSIQDISEEDDIDSGFGVFRYSKKDDSTLLERYSHMLQNLVSFEKDTDEIKSATIIISKLQYAVKRVLPVKDAALLFFDDSLTSLKPIDSNDKSEIISVMNHYYKEGIFNLLFESGKPMAVPELNSYNSDGPRLNFILFPILEDGKKKGLFVLLSSISQQNFSELDKQIIKILLNVCLAKIDKFVVKERLYSTYEELQTYQAKLSNDFRLAAIGELTEGIVEDIMTPMQVIMSQVGLIEIDSGENDELKKIKSQINKVNSVINRLVKFASINQKDIEIMPCNLNEVIGEYHTLVKSTLDSLNLECVHDFESNIPSVLSHPNYIFQLLTNMIGLVKSNEKEGGIIIQTLDKGDHIVLKVITTAELRSDLKNNGTSNSADLNIRIISNLMKKHEGEFLLESFKDNGSAMTLKFPLRRKIRK